MKYCELCCNYHFAAGGGVDYDSGPYTVRFSAGQTSVIFNVPITDDNILEADESFSLTIIIRNSLPNRVTYDGDGPAEVTIVDNDRKWFMC